MTTRPRTKRKSAPRTASGKLPIDLALQGGGSHGAFTWGVLDRLLDDDTLGIAGLSGTSAGALNAAVLATESSPGVTPERVCAMCAAISRWPGRAR